MEPSRPRRVGGRPRTPGLLAVLGFLSVGLAGICGVSWLVLQVPSEDLPQGVPQVAGVAAIRSSLGEGIPCDEPVAQVDAALASRTGLESARACLVARLDDEPDDPTAWLALVELDATTGSGLGRSDRRTLLDAVDQFHPGHPRADMASAAHDVACGYGVAAIGVLTRSPAARARRLELDAWLELREFSDARAAAAVFLEQDPSDDHACLALARAEWGRADWRAAEEVVSTCVEAGAAPRPLITLSGRIADETGRRDVAESRYVAADARAELGALLWQTGRDSDRVDQLLAGAPREQAWRALAYGEAPTGGDELTSALAGLLDGRANEALAIAQEHPADPRWLIVRARALAGSAEAAEAWAEVTRRAPDDPHAWRGRLAAAEPAQLSAVLADLARVDPQRAVLGRGSADRDAPGSVLVPALWEDVLERVPESDRDLVLLWAGRPESVRGGPDLVRSAALSELGRGAEALRFARGDSPQGRTARVAALIASQRLTDAQAELVGGLDDDEPALRGLLVLLLVARGDGEAARTAAAVVLFEHPGWQAVRNALTSVDQNG